MLVKLYTGDDKNLNECWWKHFCMLTKIQTYKFKHIRQYTISPTYMFFTNVHSFYQTLITEVWKNLWRHEKWNSIIKSWWIFSRLGSLVFLVSAVNDIRSKNLIIFYIWPNLFGFSVQSGWFSGQLDGWFIRSEKNIVCKIYFRKLWKFRHDWQNKWHQSSVVVQTIQYCNSSTRNIYDFIKASLWIARPDHTVFLMYAVRNCLRIWIRLFRLAIWDS